MLRIIPCLLLAGLGCFALPPKVMAQSAPLSDEPAVLQGQAKKHFENDQALDAERKYLAALKVYEKGLADKNQSDALLLRWCQCRNELTEVQFCLYKLSEPKALAATTMAYLQQVIPLRAKEPAFRLELAKTHQALSEGYQFLQLFVDAEKHQRTAIELLGQLVKDYPSTAEYRSTLAKGLKSHGGMLMGLARFAEAEAAYAEAERIGAKLVADAPKAAEFALDLAMIFNAHALLIRESGRFPQAVEAMSRRDSIAGENGSRLSGPSGVLGPAGDDLPEPGSASGLPRPERPRRGGGAQGSRPRRTQAGPVAALGAAGPIRPNACNGNAAAEDGESLPKQTRQSAAERRHDPFHLHAQGHPCYPCLRGPATSRP